MMTNLCFCTYEREIAMCFHVTQHIVGTQRHRLPNVPSQVAIWILARGCVHKEKTIRETGIIEQPANGTDPLRTPKRSQAGKNSRAKQHMGMRNGS